MAGREIDFDRASAGLSIDLQGGVKEVRAGATVPLPRRKDLNLFTGTGLIVPREEARKPKGLDLHLIHPSQRGRFVKAAATGGGGGEELLIIHRRGVRGLLRGLGGLWGRRIEDIAEPNEALGFW